MKKNLLSITLCVLLNASLQLSFSQTVSIDPDAYKQEFIGVGGSVGNYFGKYFDNSPSDQQKICQWLAQDLNYKYLKSYDGDKHPNDNPSYYDDRATFYNDLKAYRSDIELMICFNQVSNMYQTDIDNNVSGVYDVIAQRYFDIIEAYYVRNATVTVIELLNEPGGSSQVVRKGKVYSYAVPKLRDLINNSSSNPNGVPMPKVAGPGTWGVAQCPHWINGFKSSSLPNAWSNLDIVTTHGYNEGWKVNLYQDIYDIIEGKPFYNSEQTGKEHAGDGLYEQEGTIDRFISAGLSICQRYIAGMNGGGINSFLAFQNYNTKDNNAALLQVTSGNPPIRKKMYFAFKQVTSIQPENCYRVANSRSGLDNNKVLTMRKNGESYVYLHLLNIDAGSKNVTIDVRKGTPYNIISVEAWVTDEFSNDATQTMNTTYSTGQNSINVTLAGHSVTTYRLGIEPGGSGNTYNTYYINHKGSGYRLKSTGSDATLVSSSNTGNDVKWILTDAGSGYTYIENVADDKRLHSSDGATVNVVANSNSGNNVQWNIDAANSTYDFILNRTSGKKLHAKSSTGWDVRVESASKTGNNVKWSIEFAGTITKSATISTEIMTQQDVMHNHATCYPNPVKDILYISGINEMNKVEIYNMLGEKILSTNYTGAMNVDHIQNGMYLLVIDGNKPIRFIKE